jgi:hypothetical protein
MTTTSLPTASPPPVTEAPPLTFDERLRLAALAVDARINTKPLDLADVIRIPAEAPTPLTPTAAPCPYSTPIAGLLHRARVRIETVGWCRDNLFDEDGAVCPIRAIRLEASSRGQADDACVLLLDVIQRDFADAETIPAWNAQQASAAPVLLYLDRAATLAHNRNL